jgi:hypothetical protein
MAGEIRRHQRCATAKELKRVGAHSLVPQDE